MLIKRKRLSYPVLRNNYGLHIFVVLTRYLVGFSFIPSGLKKMLGERFTQLSIDNPVGFFFEGLYQSGAYWNFLGLGQMFTALLLMTQRFATLGAILFFFIASNIWVITVSIQFSGTVYVATLMALAAIMLLAWDYNKIKFLFAPDNYFVKARPTQYPTFNKAWIREGIFLFCFSIAGFIAMEQFKDAPKFIWVCWLTVMPLSVLVVLIRHRRDDRVK